MVLKTQKKEYIQVGSYYLSAINRQKEYTMKLFISGIIFILLIQIQSPSFCQNYVKSLKQITFSTNIDYYPSISPDGKSIVFSSRGPEISNIKKIMLTGEKEELLTTVHSGHPSWSPDGKYIAFNNMENRLIQIVSSSGGTPIRILPDFFSARRNRDPCWSFYGSQIAFYSDGDIYAVDVASGKSKFIYRKEGYNARPFCWSGDGLKILSEISDTSRTTSEIWILSTNNEKAVKVADFPGRKRNPFFSPDDSMIVFMSDHGGNQDIWIMTSTGGNPIQITSHPKRDMNPRWSPDGKFIVFASERSGNRDIWLMEIDFQAIKRKLLSGK